MEARCQLPVLHLQQNLRQRGDACRGLEMPDIGFYGSESDALRTGTECPLEAFEFDRIAE